MLTPLINFLDAIYPLSLPLKEALRANLIHETFPKHHLLLREGQKCEYIYFVRKGLLRAYYYEDEKDITSFFMKEQDVVISPSSFFVQQPSSENIELLEKTELIYLHNDILQEIYTKFLEFNVIGRLLTEKYFILSLERVLILRKKKKEERYQYMLDKYPELLKRVPVSYLASYLGMTPSTLSRVRGNQ